jgi:diguanylate cyclase (GGDEF)-like protein
LLTRRHFTYLAEAALKRELLLSLIMIDIDHFKHVNDAYGHPFGDRVLEMVSQALKEECREADFVGRLGGEEFAIALPNIHRLEALAIAESLRRKVEQLSFDQPIRITISLGISTFPAHGETLPRLIEAADRALYASKGNGRNRITVATE